MPAAHPKRQADASQAGKPRHAPPQIYSIEATGLLIISALILFLTIIRYWHYIYWGWR